RELIRLDVSIAALQETRLDSSGCLKEENFTFFCNEDIKDHFYDVLDSLIGKIPKVAPLILLGDFNARVGSDHQSWPSCIGHHGTGRMNDNGQRLCSFHGLYITNTFFQSNHQQKVSWKHPRSHKWHQLDLVIARRSALNNVLATRSYHSADCDT
ncbi:Craniofacial development protein 2, partial [Lamellibrachia satsuma]